jgi:TorA maturation chaperone TorD
MQTEPDPAPELAVDLAREVLYRFLAAALRGPGGPDWCWVLDAEGRRLAGEAADLLRAEAEVESAPLGFGELPPEMLSARPVCAWFQRPDEELAAAYAQAFGLAAQPECPPYETEYQRNAEPFFRAQQMADVAGFYQAFGLEPAHAWPERPDHLALELEFMAFLLLKKRLARAEGGPDAAEQVQVCEAALRGFFRDHLAWWVPGFAVGLQRKAERGFCADLGRLLAAFIPVERVRLGVRAPRLPVEAIPTEPPEGAGECAGCAARG